MARGSVSNEDAAMIQSAFTIQGVTVYHADCLDVLPQLEAGSVDAVVTDPPYGVNIAAWDGEMPPQHILTDCLRVAVGAVIWFGAATKLFGFADYVPRPDRIAVWAPRFTLSKTSSNGMFYRWHPIALWRLGKTTLGSDLLDVPCDGHNWWNHPATKPVPLFTKLIKSTCSKIVLDPFAGSGTTGVACIKTGRRCILIEKEAKYVEIIRRRLTDASTPLLDKCTETLEQP